MADDETYLSPREWQVMRCCWRLGRASTHDVLRAVLADGEIEDYRTLQEFLRRISLKGFLRISKEGRINYYEPIVDRDQAVDAMINRFLSETLENDRRDLERLGQAVARHLAKLRQGG